MAMSEEQRNKLVNLGALEKVAGALKAVANKAAADAVIEKERAMAAEEDILEIANANADAIDAINDQEDGILAQAKAHAQGLVNGEESRAKGVEEGLARRIADNEAFVTAQPAKDKAQDDRIADLEAMMGIGGEQGQQNALDAIRGDIEKAQKAAEDAQKDVDNVELRLDAEGGLVARIAANEGALAVLNGDENAEGSVKKQIAAAVAGEKGRAEGQEAAIRQELANEKAALQKEIGEEKAALQAEIDADVKVEKERAEAKEAELNQAIANEAQRADAEEKRIVGLVEAEAIAARAAEKANADAIEILKGDENVVGSVKQQINDAIDAVNGAAETLAGRVTTAEGRLDIIQGSAETAGSIAKAEADAKAYADQKVAALVDGAPETLDTLNELAAALRDDADVLNAIETAFDKKLDNKVDKVDGSRLISETEAAVYAAKAEVADVTKCLQDAKDYADGKDAVVQGNVNALADIVGKKAEGENAATGIFAEMATMKANCEKAMEDEVTARNQAISNALEPYSNTEEMKQFVGNVVSSLSLQIAENKVVLKLGGVEGITVAEAELNIATDEEINAILGDLVQDQGE